MTKHDEPSQRQAARSEAMRARLIAATKQSLLDRGYGRTTAVEVCVRAGVTRGALFHHFSSFSSLLAATLDEMYAATSARSAAVREKNPQRTMSAFIDAIWSSFGDPDFKIVIEVWLAARNDPGLREELTPVIERFKRLATPELNDRLADTVGRSAERIAFYRLAIETMIGMALGRAVNPDGNPMGHEEMVMDLLKKLASDFDGAR